jgi:uncharacterized UPF0160 family protein
MIIDHLITHSGAFHADDLFAHALLSTLYPAAGLVRTRDTDILSDDNIRAIIFDVGNVYDTWTNRYDHHQADKPIRDEGLAYSSFGLIWKHYGESYIKDIEDLGIINTKEIHQRIDQSLVRDIDAIDNGTLQPDQKGLLNSLSLVNMLMDFRPNFDDDDPKAMDRAFVEASAVASIFLKKKVIKTAAAMRSEMIIHHAMENKTHPNWIELPRGMGHTGPILDAGDTDIHYVVNPGPGEWQLNVVNSSKDSYDMHAPLPAHWAGLRDEKLADVTGVEDAIFCHTGRFIAIAKSRGGIMQLLEQALASK